MIIQLLWICLGYPGKMREPDGSFPVMLHGSTKESLSIPCSPPDNAQHGHILCCSPRKGLASQNNAGVLMLYDWRLYPGMGKKDLQGIARNNLCCLEVLDC